MIRMNAPPWRLGAATAILGLAAACAAQPRGDTIGPNEFRRAGDTLLCFTLEQPGKAAGTNPSEQDCLRIGSVRIGQPAAEIRHHFGKPYDTLEHLGATVLVYPIGPDADPMPYWAISVRDGSVIAIQITGRSEPQGNAFSSLRLGDRVDKVRRVLGAPAATKAVEDIGATLWSYEPFPISIEIKDERVYSMKIWQPERAAPGRSVMAPGPGGDRPG